MNVPYDSGIVIIKDARLHSGLKTERCAYAGEASDDKRDGSSWVPENSRRARGFALYAAIRELGRQGVCQIIENSCAMAKRFAERIQSLENTDVLNEVTINQVLFRVQTLDESGHQKLASEIQTGNHLPSEKLSIS